MERCLEKDPHKRLRHIGDVMSLVDDGRAVVPLAAAPQSGSRSWLWPSIAAVLIVALAAVLGWNWWSAPRQKDRPLVRLDVDLGQEIVLPAPVPFVSNVVVSPDGTRLAYIASVGSAGAGAKLFTRKLDQAKATELTGAEGARGPFFSPDGNWLGFYASGKLYKVSVDGGASVPLIDLGSFAGASWGEDFIVVAEGRKPIARISPGGGAQTPLTEFTSREVYETSPQVLPGGKAVLFSSNQGAGPDTASVEALSLADRRRKVLVQGGAFPRYVPSGAKGNGHILYTFKGALYAIPFDLDKLETRGIAVPVLDDVSVGGGVAAKFDVSQTGILVYQKTSGEAESVSTIQWLDSSGKQQPLLARPGAYFAPHLSPNGKRLALSVRDGGYQDIQVYDWQSDRTTKLTFGGGIHRVPIWSPDGQYVVFSSSLPVGMHWTRADGSGQPQRIISTQAIPSSFSPDGKRLAYVDSVGNYQIWTVPIEQQNGRLKMGTPEPFLSDNFVDANPTFSPDGKWLAYSSAEAGTRVEVYVRPFPPAASGQGGKWVISTQGGDFPVWSRTGHELLYQAPNGQIMAAGYSVKGETFQVEKARVWMTAYGESAFDLSPDGRRLAAVMPVQSAVAPKPEHEVAFIENFFEELRRKVPVGGK